MATPLELDLARRPIVQDSLAHNVRTLSSIRAPASFLLGLAAGALSLTSLPGFLLYLAGSLLTSVFVYVLLLERQPRRFLYAAPSFSADKKKKSLSQTETRPGGHAALAWDVCFGGGVLGVEGVMGFIMAWTLAYNYIGGGA